MSFKTFKYLDPKTISKNQIFIIYNLQDVPIKVLVGDLYDLYKLYPYILQSEIDLLLSIGTVASLFHHFVSVTTFNFKIGDSIICTKGIEEKHTLVNIYIDKDDKLEVHINNPNLREGDVYIGLATFMEFWKSFESKKLAHTCTCSGHTLLWYGCKCKTK